MKHVYQFPFIHWRSRPGSYLKGGNDIDAVLHESAAIECDHVQELVHQVLTGVQLDVAVKDKVRNCGVLGNVPGNVDVERQMMLSAVLRECHGTFIAELGKILVVWRKLGIQEIFRTDDSAYFDD